MGRFQMAARHADQFERIHVDCSIIQQFFTIPQGSMRSGGGEGWGDLGPKKMCTKTGPTRFSEL